MGSTGKPADESGSTGLDDPPVSAAGAHESNEEQRRLAAVAQLAAGVAHDFNNILTVVVGIAERLTQQTRLPRAVRAKLELIAQQGHRGTELIRQLTDFSRQSPVPGQTPLDLAALVADRAAALQRSAGPHVHLTIACAAGSHMIHGDMTQLQQILAHLIANARAAIAGAGDVRIGVDRITVGPHDAPPVAGMPRGDWIRLSVTDTGTGMPPDVLQHAFEPFFTTREPGQGTGLGLAQVYGLVKQHGGFIGISSQPGRGTTVDICLPAASAHRRPMLAADHQPSPRGQGETILLVEDEAAVRAILKWQFEGMGYRVLATATGEEALDLFGGERDTVALAVIDWLLPGMGGAQLYRSLRAANPTLPMLALSGYPPEVGAAQAGIDRDARVQWLQKPAGLQPLAQAVRQALHSRGERTA